MFRLPCAPGMGVWFCPLSSVLFPLSSVLCPLSSVLCPLSSVLCPLSSVLCPLSSVLCPLSSVLCPLSSVLCPLSLLTDRASGSPAPRFKGFLLLRGVFFLAVHEEVPVHKMPIELRPVDTGEQGLVAHGDAAAAAHARAVDHNRDRKSTRLNSSHGYI